MKNLKHYCFIVFIALLASSCDKDEPFVAPEISTTEVTEVTNTTAIINAEITELGSEPILKYGFIWAEGYDDILSMDDGKVEYLDGNPKEGKISFELKDLDQAKDYSYNAFIQTAKEVYINRYDSGFTMASPEITDISPKEGSGGTVVTITGQYLTANKDAISLQLGSEEAEILEASESEITFIAPEVSSGSRNIELVVNGVRSQSEIAFKYLKYFKLNKAYIRSDQKIGVFVNGGISINSETDRANIDFKINGQSCEVIFDWPVLPDGASSGYAIGYNIYFQTPEDLKPGEASLEVISGGGYQYYNKNNTLTVLPPDMWVKKNNISDRLMGNCFGFTKGDFGYVLDDYNLYQYDPTSDSWEVYKDLYTQNYRRKDAIGLIGDELLILKGKALKSFNFFGDYTMARAEFPGEERNGAANFVVNNNFYYGLGYIGDVFQNDLWKYNIDKDEWTRLSDCPSRDESIKYYRDYALVKDKEVFIGKFEYDYITDTYKESKSSYRPSYYSLLIEDKIYSYGTDNYVFDSFDDNRIKYKSKISISNYSFERNDWIKNTHCPGISSSNYFAFEINGKMYIGGEDDSSEFWEFIPAE